MNEIRVEVSLNDGCLYLWVWGPGGPAIANVVHQTYWWSTDPSTFREVLRDMHHRWRLVKIAQQVAVALGVELELASDGSSLVKDFDADREPVAS